jgi:hypothetical protein
MQNKDVRSPLSAVRRKVKSKNSNVRRPPSIDRRNDKASTVDSPQSTAKAKQKTRRLLSDDRRKRKWKKK